MTDNEIIKAMENCMRNDAARRSCIRCDYFNYSNNCLDKLVNDALDLINRQKAEIERLQKENKILSVNSDTAFQDGLNEAQDLYAEQIKNEVRSEAITEFADRLRKYYNRLDNSQGSLISFHIDQIAKETKEGVNNA